MSFPVKSRFHNRPLPEKAAIVFAVCSLSFAALAGLVQFYSDEAYGAVRVNVLLDAKNYLSVAMTNVDAEILLYDGEQIKLDYTGENKLRVSENSYSVTIEQDEGLTLSVLSPEMFSYKLTLYLPDMLFKEVKVTSVSGSVLCDGFNAERIAVTTRSGDIIFRNAGNIVTEIIPETSTGKIYYY